MSNVSSILESAVSHSCESSLSPLSPPVIVAPLVPASVTVNESDTLMVTCDITNSNGPFILSTTWRNAQDGSEVDNNRLLDRVGVSRSFAGEYICVVRSRNNEDYNSTITTITIQCEWYMIVPI